MRDFVLDNEMERSDKNKDGFVDVTEHLSKCLANYSCIIQASEFIWVSTFTIKGKWKSVMWILCFCS